MRRIFIIAAAVVIASLITLTITSSASIKEQIRFGTEMAKKGNWLEAIFRWQKALESEPENYKLHNNLAVANEALGRYEEAYRAYREALKYCKNNKEVKDNYQLFMKFYSQQEHEGTKRQEIDTDRNIPSSDALHD